jgi:uncharacterized protein (TIGR02421 family)
MPMRPELRDRALARAASVLEPVARSSRLLDAIAWPRRVERAFFAANAEVQPEPVYELDRDLARANIEALQAAALDLGGDHPLLSWLRAVCASYIDANRMILAVGTREFYTLSYSIYGGARTTALDNDTTNLDFAEHVGARLGGPGEHGAEASIGPAGERLDRARAPALDASGFVTAMERQLARRTPPLPMEIVRDPDLSAKVLCGMKRMRVREGALFAEAEADSLYVHEVETHALTAQNGDAQLSVPFLRAGGPRTTRAQEGLAVFSELYAHSLSTERLRRLVDRVRMVAMAEDGASFLDLYRHLVERGVPEHDAYLDAQRICRGGIVLGGAPFTKDASYLSGLMDVYNFLRVAVRAGARAVAEVLVSGRIALEDVEALTWLRAEGVLAPPRFVPSWLAHWDGLLAYFAFTSFLNEVDLAPVEERHKALLSRAASVARTAANADDTRGAEP